MQLDGGDRRRAVAEVDDHRGLSALRRSRQAWGPASQRSTRRRRLGLVVPRVMVPTGRCPATRAAYAGRSAA